MKFLAILKDSVREAIDYKVFYVMVGLSVLIAVLALSLSFTPVAGAREVVQDFAILPLNNDADSLDSATAFNVLFQLRPLAFSVKSVEPLDGAPDVPTSRLKVVLEAKFNTADAAQKGEANPEQLVDFVRERFGRIEGQSMMEVRDVRLLGWEGFNIPLVGRNFGGRKATLEVQTSPTPATVRFWPHRTELLFGAVPLSPKSGVPLFSYLGIIESGVVGALGSTIAVLVSIVITAFFIPSMLRKGTVDLLLVKPIRRPSLLVYKYIGGLTFIFLNTVVAVAGIWLALGLRSGVWPVSFLLTILVLTYVFAILYSVSAFFGVLTRSPIAAILLTIGVWFFMFGVRAFHGYFEVRRAMERTAQALHDKLGDEGLKALQGMADVTVVEAHGNGPPRGRPPRLEDLRFEENWFTQGIAVLYKILPRTSDLGAMLNRRLTHDLAFGDPWLPPAKTEKPPPELPGGIPMPQVIATPPSLTEVLGISTAFIAVFLGLACWRFAAKDY
jgi:ABC-type transport system involved in multi-copper enzyme maturation permease subunit